MPRFLMLILPFLLSILPAAAETVQLGDRYYQIERPANPRGAPLILALHGGGGNPDQFASASGLGRDAVSAG
jgi:poly(3-hydroxybutyrate) depolymerase